MQAFGERLRSVLRTICVLSFSWAWEGGDLQGLGRWFHRVRRASGLVGLRVLVVGLGILEIGGARFRGGLGIPKDAGWEGASRVGTRSWNAVSLIRV